MPFSVCASDSRARGFGFDIRSGHNNFVSPSAESRSVIVTYWRKYLHEVLVNSLGSLSLPRKSVVRLTDRPEITIAGCRGRAATAQQCARKLITLILFVLY